MADNEHDGMKFCGGCETWKLATAEYFNRDKTKKGGLRSRCKECCLEYRREYRQKNKEKIAERKREYYQKNKDRAAEYRREYRQKNKEKLAEREREYNRSGVGRLSEALSYIRKKTGATIYLRDMTDEEKETLANQYVAVITLEKTEKELLAASGKKRCAKCDRILDYDCFYKNNDGYAGLKSYCKACASKQKRQKDKKTKSA